jgi:DNA polymerase sigma
MFGSTASGFALKGSDIDLLVFYPAVKFNVLCDQIHKRLLKVKAFEYVERIYASVPILKLKDNKTGLFVDIAFNRDDGIYGCLVSVFSGQLYPELRPLYFIIKAFLRERELDQTRKGGVCSFMIINMLVYFLQQQYKEKKVN